MEEPGVAPFGFFQGIAIEFFPSFIDIIDIAFEISDSDTIRRGFDSQRQSLIEMEFFDMVCDDELEDFQLIFG